MLIYNVELILTTIDAAIGSINNCKINIKIDKYISSYILII